MDRQFSLPRLERLLENLIEAGVLKTGILKPRLPLPPASCAAIGGAALSVAGGESDPVTAETLIVGVACGLLA